MITILISLLLQAHPVQLQTKPLLVQGTGTPRQQLQVQPLTCQPPYRCDQTFVSPFPYRPNMFGKHALDILQGN